MMDTSTTPARADRDTPRQIGPYTLLERLGAGGMGDVYLAEQKQPVRRRVALKLVKIGLDTREFVARFEAERQALALMNHPNVAAVYDGGATPDGRPYFVMEYVPGAPITDYCNKHKLSIRERLELFIQVCNAVQHAHQKAIIHRDLKPNNVLVMVGTEPRGDPSAGLRAATKGSAGILPAILGGRPGSADSSPATASAVVKVIDFGVAKATNQRLTDKTLFTQHGVLVGTPEYMSPEQAESTTLDIDTRTDIYALGVVLYELLTGTLPFDRASLRRAPLHEIVRIIREVEPPKPSTRLSSLRDGSKASRRGAAQAEARSVAAPYATKDGEKPLDARSADSSAGVDAHSTGSGVPDISPSARARIEAALADAPGADPSSLVERTERAESAGDPLAVPAASLDRIATQRRADAQSLLRTIRGDLDWIVMKCLEKDRTRRYDTANALAMEIRRYQNNEPVLAGPPSAAYRLRKFVRRNRGAVIAASLVAAAMLLGLVGTGTGMVWARREQARAQEEARKSRLAEQEQVRLREQAAQQHEQVVESMRISMAIGTVMRESFAAALIDGRGYAMPVGEALTAGAHNIDRIIASLGVGDREGLTTVRTLLRMYGISLQAYACAEEQSRAMVSENDGDHRNDERLISALYGLGEVLVLQNKHAEAEQTMRRVQAEATQLFGRNDPRSAVAALSLAAYLREFGKEGEANTLCDEALSAVPADAWASMSSYAAGLDKSVSRSYPQHCIRMEGALRLMRLGRYGDAEHALLQVRAAQVEDRRDPRAARLVTPTTNWIAALYDAWHAAEPDKGYDAKAAEWRAKLEEWQATTQPAAPPSNEALATRPTSAP